MRSKSCRITGGYATAHPPIHFRRLRVPSKPYLSQSASGHFDFTVRIQNLKVRKAETNCSMLSTHTLLAVRKAILSHFSTRRKHIRPLPSGLPQHRNLAGARRAGRRA